MKSYKFILASSSDARFALLKQYGLVPDVVFSPDIDESYIKDETAAKYVERLADLKVNKVLSDFMHGLKGNCIILLGADSSTFRGNKIFNKPCSSIEMKEMLRSLSGKRFSVITGVCVACIDSSGHKIYNKVFSVMTKLRMKRLSDIEIQQYLESNEWIGKSAGISLQGSGEILIPWVQGCVSNVIGLPMSKTVSAIRHAVDAIQSNM